MNSIKFPEFFIFSLLSAFRAEVAFNTRSNKTKSRSCPTRAVDENLSIRLSISGAAVRITSTFGNRMKLFGKDKDVFLIANVIQYVCL